ncbi:hypothetical protein [Elioraea rosea]|uniref:hypothetical protein n=1 Tax=Elioraea rosea TaxID=2492390 RepID=UPI0011845C07|nr:hypothetical protein [Elioraea rosea]
MHRCALVLIGLLAIPAAAEEIVSAPRPGEMETVQAGGGTARYAFVGALRCPDGQAIVGVRLAEGPLLNFLELGCAPIACDGGQCRWRVASVVWSAAAGDRTGREATHLCPAGAAVAGYRASVVPLPRGSAVASLSVQCGPVTGIVPSGAVAVGPVSDPRVTRVMVPAGRAPENAVAGSCRDRAAVAFSVAVASYAAGTGGQGAHVRALSMFCPGLVDEGIR